MNKNKGGRPATGQGERFYFPIPKVKAAHILKVIPDEKMPLVEELLQALADQANLKKSELS